MKIKTDSILVCLLLILPIFSAIDIFDSLNIIEKDYSIGLDNFGTQNQYKNKIGVSKDSDYSNLYDLPLEKNPIEDFSFDNIRFGVGESNETHIWIEDPTNRTEGYFVEVGSGYQELNASRGQTNRHWYNETSNEYTFNSDLLVTKTGVVDNTDWITREEYPYRFIVRLTNGEIYTFDNSSSINDAFGSVDNSTIWAIGIETFDGIFAFYMNPDDITWGHAQYIYYPYLLDGTLPAYNQPLYQIFPHLYVNNSGTIYDAFITNRDNYNSTNIPIDHFTAFNESDVWGMYYTISVNLLSSEWIIKNGFKYNFTDNLFHQINEIQCISHDFDDIGMAYEITSTSMSDNTPYQPNRFVLSNDTHSVTANISEAWEAGEYLEDFYSQIGIVSQNNQSFVFSFDDMENAGFTQKYLNLHNQSMPDGSYRLTLRAGMYGYGDYASGTIIEIDPTTGSIYPTDNDDLYLLYITYPMWQTGGNVARVGEQSSGAWSKAFAAYDTGITSEITDTSSANMYLDLTANYYEEGEGASARVYNIGGNFDSNSAKEDSLSYIFGTNKQETAVLLGPGTGDRSIDSTKMESLTDYWADNRGDTENYISFVLEGYECDVGINDYMTFVETQYGGDGVQHISFTYVVPVAPTAYYHSDADSVHYAGKEYAFRTSYYDDNGASDLDEVYASFGDANNDIQFYIDNIDGVSSTGSATVLYGVNYLDGGTATYSRSNVANGYVLNWTYTIDWDWDHDDSAVIDYFAYCTDDSAANSGWSTNGDFNFNYENDLILYSLDFNTNDYTGNGDQTADLNAEEWFRGGLQIRGNGTITYEGTTNVYPETTDVDAQLYIEGFDRGDGYQDAPDTSGYFETAYAPTIATAGLDTTFALDIILQNIPYEGSEGTGVEGFNVQRDNEIPTATSYLHADSADGGDYDPNDGYDDDLVADYTISGASDGSGAGLHSGRFSYNWNGGTYSGYSSDATPEITVVDGDSADSDMRVRDWVGNVATIDGEDIVIDDDAPSSSAITEGDVSGYPTDNAYLSGSTIYYDTGDSDSFTISIDSSTIGNSGLWKTEVDVDGIFTAGMTTDTSALPNIHNCAYLSRGSGTLRIRIVNNAGNYEEITYTATSDNTNPVLSDALSAFSEDSGDVGEVFSVIADNEVFFSNTFDSACVVTMTATGTDGSAGVHGIDFGSFGADNPAEDTGSPYTGTYTLNTDDITGSITVTIYDNVGNSASGSITMTEDTTSPTITQVGESESSEYLYSAYGTTVEGYYGSMMLSTENYIVSGTASDASSGLQELDDNTGFGDNPSRGGTVASWSFTYQIDAADNGDLLVTYTVYDNVGNSATDTYQFWEDNVIPYGGSFTLDADAATGGYTPNTGYYDDDSVDVTITSVVDDDSGFAAEYLWQTDLIAWGSWAAGNTHTYTSTADGSRTLYVRARDNVANYVEYNVGVIVDTNDPSGYTITFARHTGWVDSYHAYLFGSTIYFGSDFNDYFTVTGNDDGNPDNSGYWRIKFDTAGVFETPYSDYDPLPNSMNFYYQGDTSGTLYIDIINYAGNYQRFTYTATEDATKPVSYALSLSNFYFSFWDSITVYGSTTDATSGLTATNAYEWWINNERITGTSYTNTGEKTWSGLADGYYYFYAAAWDNVGNYRNATSILGQSFSIIIIINPVDEIEEIIIGGFYNEEDVFYDYPSMSVSILVEENTEDGINLIENITINHTVMFPVFDDDAQNTSNVAKNNVMVMNIIRIIPEPQWLIFMIFLQTIVEFRRRHKKRG